MFDEVLEAEVGEARELNDVSELPEVIAVKTIMRQATWQHACGCVELQSAPLGQNLFHDPLVLEALILLSQGQVLIDDDNFQVSGDPDALGALSNECWLRMLKSGRLPLGIFEWSAPEAIQLDEAVMQYLRELIPANDSENRARARILQAYEDATEIPQ